MSKKVYFEVIGQSGDRRLRHDRTLVSSHRLLTPAPYYEKEIIQND